jgi:hypothetical protein
MAADPTETGLNRAELMHPWSRINLILAAALAILLIADFWPTAGSAYPPLTSLTADVIEHIRIERDARLQIGLQRQDGGWRLNHPDDAAASIERVQQLLAVLRAPVFYGFPAEGDLDRFGLTEPTLLLHLSGPSGERHIAFGDREPNQSGRYVLVDDEVRVIDDLFFNLLSLPPRHFRGD